VAFVPPLWFGTLFWAQRDGDQDDPQAPLVEIRPGELDCTETARRRIWKQFEDAASWQRLMVEIVGPTYDELELAIGSVDLGRYLSTAEGLVLEEIGALVGRPRGALVDDDLYRLAIRADAATLFSSGTIPEVVEIASSLLGPLTEVRQYFPATVVIGAPDTPTAVFQVLLEILEDDLLVVGVAGFLETWDGDPDEGVGGWGSTTDPGDTEITAAGAWSTTTGTDADAGLALWSDRQPFT